MAWIESHQELREHPKTKRMARMLGIAVPTAIGHLHCLWWWAMEYAEDGKLTGWEPIDIAEAAMWPGEPAQLLRALVECGPAGKPGFVDIAEDGDPVALHDWYEYAGKWIERRAADRARKRKGQAPDTNEGSDGTPSEVQWKADGTLKDSIVTPTPTPTPTVPLITTTTRGSGASLRRNGEWVGLTPTEAYEKGSAKPVTQLDAELLISLVAQYGEQDVVEAIKVAAGGGNWRGGTTYVERILERWQREGKDTPRKEPRHAANRRHPQKDGEEPDRYAYERELLRKRAESASQT